MNRKIVKIFIFILVFIIIIIMSYFIGKIVAESLDTANTNSLNILVKNEIENNQNEEIVLEPTEKKYYLHESDFELPSQELCYKVQEKALSGLTEEEKNKVQSTIRNIHLNIEWQLQDAVRLIKDANSPYWEDFTSYGVFTDPYTGIKVDHGGRFLYTYDTMKEIANILKDEETKKDINSMLNILKEGMESHDIEKCFKAHEIIHDYDYWVINTPVHLETAPADWGGVTTYFNTVSIMKD